MRRLPLLCAFLLLTGCYDSRFGERSGGEEPEPATATIAQLRQLYAGTTFVIATDVVVSGRVNTSDAEENFYRTFCVEEDGAGLEVMAGIDQLHNDFPPGSRVTLRLKGLALGESRRDFGPDRRHPTRFRLPGRSGRHHLLQRAYAGRLRRQDSARSRARRRLRRRADSA